MDFAPTEGQETVRGLARDVLARTLDDARLRAALAGAGDDPVTWAAFADAGLLAATLPEPHGGLGFLELTTLLVELGRAAVPGALTPTLLGGWVLGRSASRPRRDDVLAGIAAGEHRLGLALAEPGRRALDQPTLDGPALRGTKAYVLSAAHARWFLVLGRGPRLWLAEAAEVDVQPATGDRSAGQVRFDGPAEPVDTPWAEAHAALLVGLAALQLGLASSAVERTARHVSARQQFGVPVGTFQAVSQRIADAYVQTQVMEVALWRAAARIHHGEPALREAHLARALASDGLHQVLAAAQHLHGGLGFDRDYPLHRSWLLGKQLEFVLGTAVEHYDALGRLGRGG